MDWVRNVDHTTPSTTRTLNARTREDPNSRKQAIIPLVSSQILFISTEVQLLPNKHDLLEAASLTMLVFGLLVWFYVILIQVTHPEWLSLRFSHIDLPPFNWRLDEIGMIAFAVAVLGFFTWRLEGSRKA